ncbi:MAG: hypothetical protein JXR63_01080 [Spirochaetales bacterium]|nr:hypothetical protein [Spirochaetales bacterium]
MKSNKIYFLIIGLLMLSANAIFAQSNQLIDSIVARDKALLGESALIILQAAELIDLNATSEDAMGFLENEKWLKKLDADRSINQGELCLLIMMAFKIKGGAMFTMTRAPRYAARELAAIGGLTEKTSPYKSVSGQEVMMLLSWALDFTQKGEAE